jgi:hypothetical protein
MNRARALVSLLVSMTGLMPLSALALEFSLDVGPASSENAVGWGLASHAQVMRDTRWGLDVGYLYQSELEYPTDNGTLNHTFYQYELGLIWQQGHVGARFQGVAGMIIAGNDVTGNNNESILPAGALGYRLDADISVPVADHLRVFASAGYQDYYTGDMPAQWRWRYGVRFTFGERMSAAERDARARSEARQSQSPSDSSAEVSAASEPERRLQPIPTYLSQSLPPIIERSELCKCFPAGPYTMQLGQFPGMEQAVRAMEYRGLRQFFTTVAYDRDPQPVFLAQAEPDGPVALFLGEYDQLADTEIWRRRLRLSGIEGRIRQVVGTSGRIANRTVDASAQARVPQYTAEEIRRMNSVSPAGGADTTSQTMAESRASVNQPTSSAGTDTSDATTHIPDTLVLGPVSADTLVNWMSEPALRDALLTDATRQLPGRHRLIWDAARSQAWIYLDQFSAERQLDEWQAWLERNGQSASVQQIARLPVGDTYVYHLGDALRGYSLELYQQADAGDMLARLTSPEILWFQAYQSINDEPPTLVVQWQASDQQFHLIASGFDRDNDARRAWRNLSSVGLMPVLQE